MDESIKKSPLPFLLKPETKTRFNKFFKSASDEALTKLLDSFENQGKSEQPSVDTEHIAELQSQIDTINAEKNRLEVELTEAKKSVSENAQRILDKDNEIKNLNQQLSQAKTETEEAKKPQADIDNLKNAIAEKDKLIESMKADMLKMNKQTSTDEQTINALNQQLQEKDAKIKELEDELQKARTSSAAATDQNGEDRKVIDGLLAAKAALENERKTLKHNLDETKAELERVKHTVLEFEQGTKQSPLNSYPEGDILHYFPEITARLLSVTCERLTEKRRRITRNPEAPEITPAEVLADNFLKYTIQRWNLWFYKWVLNDNEILSIAQEVEPEIKSIKALKAILNIKD